MPMYKVLVERWTCELGSYDVYAESEYDARVLGRYRAMDDPNQYVDPNFEFIEKTYKTHQAVPIEPPQRTTEVESKPKTATKKVSNTK